MEKANQLTNLIQREQAIQAEYLALEKLKKIEPPPPTAEKAVRKWSVLRLIQIGLGVLNAFRPVEIEKEVAPGHPPLKRHEWEVTSIKWIV